MDNNKHYLFTLTLLCSCGFFKEIRPTEPYLIDYLTDPNYKNLTENQVYDEVYPVWPYSYFALLIPVFLLTDILRYKPIIVFEIGAYWSAWALLFWGNGVTWMKLMQFTFGLAAATEVAYYTYIYAKVSVYILKMP